MDRRERPIGMDLFCGVGGMSLGFEQAGFDIVAAIDSDPIHFETYSKNFPMCRTLCADLSNLSGDDIRLQTGLGERQVDVLFGGPPCQGFSIIGKRCFDDPRNSLLYDFARLVSELRPCYFVVENVQGLLFGKAATIIREFLSRIEEFSYSFVEPVKVLDAIDYGVPQRRRRVFILGYMKGLPAPEYPTPSLDNGCYTGPSRPTVWDAIGDLPNIDDFRELLQSDVYHGELDATSYYSRILRGDTRDLDDNSYTRHKNGYGLSGCLRTVHTPETVRRFAATEPGTYEPVSQFYRLTKDGCAPTLRAGTGRSHGSFTAPRPIHPVYPRCISVREAARLHSFPDWFCFHPTKWHGFRQVGNSLPPFLAREVAKSIQNCLSKLW